MSKIKLNDELLVTLIQGQPCLYDKAMKEYRDVHQKENVWDFIASTLGVSKEDVKNRWTILRQRYSREKQMISAESRSGAEGGRKSRWPLYEFLKFLDKHVVARKTFTNMGSNFEDKTPNDFSEEYEEESVTLQSQYSPVTQYTEDLSQDMLCDHFAATSPLPPKANILSIVPSKQTLNISTKNGFLKILPSASTSTTSPNNESDATPLPTVSSTYVHASQVAPNSSETTPKVKSNRTVIKRKCQESLDDSINTVQDCIKTWQQTVEKKNKYTVEVAPEAPFADFIANELSGFKNPRNRDKVKGKTCQMIFQYKHQEEDIDFE